MRPVDFHGPASYMPLNVKVNVNVNAMEMLIHALEY